MGRRCLTAVAPAGEEEGHIGNSGLQTNGYKHPWEGQGPRTFLPSEGERGIRPLLAGRVGWDMLLPSDSQVVTNPERHVKVQNHSPHLSPILLFGGCHRQLSGH